MQKPKYVGISQNCFGPSFEPEKYKFKDLPHTGGHPEPMLFRDFDRQYIVGLRYFFVSFLNISKEVQAVLGSLSCAINQLAQTLPKMIKDTYYQQICKDKKNNRRFRVIAKQLIEDEEESSDSDDDKSISCSDVSYFLSHMAIIKDQSKTKIEETIAELKTEVHSIIRNTIEETMQKFDLPDSMTVDKTKNMSSFSLSLESTQDLESQQTEGMKKKPGKKYVPVLQSKSRQHKASDLSSPKSLINSCQASGFRAVKDQKHETQDQKDRNKKVQQIERPYNLQNKIKQQSISKIDNTQKSEQWSSLLIELDDSVDQSSSNMGISIQQEDRSLRLKDLHDCEMRRAPFDIKLRVVRQIQIKFITEKIHKRQYAKIKFIAGDQTAMVVCFTDYQQFIVPGSVILLKNCSLYTENGRYREIQCYHTELLKGSNFPNANIKGLCLSLIHDRQKLMYVENRRTQHFRSIRAIAHSKQWLNGQDKLTNLEIIAKIQEIIMYDQDDRHLLMNISDPTGNILIKIKNFSKQKYLQADLKNGDTIFIDSLTAICETIQGQKQLSLEATKSLPKVLTNIRYTDICPDNASQIHAKYLAAQKEKKERR